MVPTLFSPSMTELRLPGLQSLKAKTSMDFVKPTIRDIGDPHVSVIVIARSRLLSTREKREASGDYFAERWRASE